MKWLFFSIIAIFAWGVWGIFTKISLRHYIWQQTFIITSLVMIIASFIIYFYSIYPNENLSFSSSSFYYALAVGITGVIAYYGFYNAIKFGKVVIVVPLTSLYPVITIVLSLIFLGEKISIPQGLGIIFAIVAIVLFSIS
jgi:transporter family protein